MKPHKPLLAALLVCLFFIQCNCNKDADKPKADNPYGLPDATQTGKGVFACLINGQKFIAGTLYNDNSSLNSAGLYEDTLGLSGTPKNSKYFQGISFTIPPVDQDMTYFIDSINVVAIYGTDSTCKGISFNITTSFSKTGTIQLTKYDTISKIVSGTFTGLTFPIPDCDTLHVTDGRFDYRYY